MTDSGALIVHNCGFGGGLNAMQAMGANYGLFVPDDEGKIIVARWREANPWATTFWERLFESALSAIANPLQSFQAGRVHFIYLPDYLRGSLLCVLPSGRFLTYRDIRYESVADLDEDDEPTGTYSKHLRCSRGHSRIKLWHGIFAENVTQAVAADCLRGALRRFEDEGLFTRLHTHDEILVECDYRDAEEVAATMRDIMRQGFDWSEGLPLWSDETIAYAYTKHEDSTWS